MLFPIILVLKALYRLKEANEHLRDRLTLCDHPFDSTLLTSQESDLYERPQCIYLDPMYPAGWFLLLFTNSKVHLLVFLLSIIHCLIQNYRGGG